LLLQPAQHARPRDAMHKAGRSRQIGRWLDSDELSRTLATEQGIQALTVILAAHGGKQRHRFRVAAGEHGQPLLEPARRITRSDLAARLLPEVLQQWLQLAPAQRRELLPSTCGGNLPSQVRARNQATAKHD